jgi:hypothetical protein
MVLQAITGGTHCRPRRRGGPFRQIQTHVPLGHDAFRLVGVVPWDVITEDRYQRLQFVVGRIDPCTMNDLIIRVGPVVVVVVVQ